MTKQTTERIEYEHRARRESIMFALEDIGMAHRDLVKGMRSPKAAGMSTKMLLKFEDRVMALSGDLVELIGELGFPT
jgi:hypothetical protein